MTYSITLLKQQVHSLEKEKERINLDYTTKDENIELALRSINDMLEDLEKSIK